MIAERAITMAHDGRNPMTFQSGSQRFRAKNDRFVLRVSGPTLRSVQSVNTLRIVGHSAISGAMTRETTVMSLIKIFRLGPAVSLNGSPTVSPTTAAW